MTKEDTGSFFPLPSFFFFFFFPDRIRFRNQLDKNNHTLKILHQQTNTILKTCTGASTKQQLQSKQQLKQMGRREISKTKSIFEWTERIQGNETKTNRWEEVKEHLSLSLSLARSLSLSLSSDTQRTLWLDYLAKIPHLRLQTAKRQTHFHCSFLHMYTELENNTKTAVCRQNIGKHLTELFFNRRKQTNIK